MRTIKLLTILSLCLHLSGCFIFIPGVVIDKSIDLATGQRGGHCVAPEVRAGDNIQLVTGERATVVQTYGTSYRCKVAKFPNRAVVQIEK